MRQCLHAHGFVVEPRSYSRQLLKEWSGSQLFCPQCGGVVYYRHGLVVTPHFAHADQSECGGYGGESETAEHQAGKQWLQKWLEQLYPANDTRQEVYVEEIRQRADVLTVFPNGQRLCIEYQCSPIEVNELRKRMGGYEQAGIEQLWIIGKSAFSGRPANRFRLQGWEKIIWERQKVLYLFDSLERHNLDVLAHIVQVQGKKTVFACKDRCEWPLLSLKVAANGRVVHLDDSPLMEETARMSPESKRKLFARKRVVAQRKNEWTSDFLSHPLRKFALARVGDCLSHPVFNQKLVGDQLFLIDHRLADDRHVKAVHVLFRRRNLRYLNGRWFEQKHHSLELLDLS